MCCCYLSLEHFSHTLHQNVLESHLMQGRYAFAKYAIAYWLGHLEDFLAELSKSKIHVDLTSLVDELGHFLDNRFHESTKARIPPNLAQRFKSFALLGPEISHENLTRAACSWASCLANHTPACNAHSNGVDVEDSSDLTSLEIFIPRLHSALDSLANRHKSPAELQDLHRFHGTRLHHCGVVQCSFFHSGFTGQLERDLHENKHTTPFACPFEGCPRTDVGFPDLKSLNCHLANAHDLDKTHNETQFPNLDDPTSIDIGAVIKKRDLAAVQRWVDQFGDLIPESFLKLKKINLGRSPRRYCRDCSPLYFACNKAGDIKILQLLLAKTPNIDRIRAELLIFALADSTKSMSDTSDMEEYLLRSIQWEKFPHSLVYQILRLARVSRSEVLSLRLLQSLSAHRDNLHPYRGESVLNLVARQGFDTCVRFLVHDCGVDPNFVTKYRRTALMDAAERGHTSTIRLLVDECQCSIDLKTKDGATAVDIAARNGHKSIIPLLLPDQTSSSTPKSEELVGICQFRQAAIDGNLDILTHYLSLDGFPIDLPDQDFYTPFLHAVENGHAEAVDMLLTQGSGRININRRCLCHHRLINARRQGLRKSGATALIIACINGYERIAERLLRCKRLNEGARAGIHTTGFRKAQLGGGVVFYPYSYTALEIAERLGFNGIVRVFRERIPNTQSTSSHDGLVNLEEGLEVESEADIGNSDDMEWASEGNSGAEDGLEAGG